MAIRGTFSPHICSFSKDFWLPSDAHHVLLSISQLGISSDVKRMFGTLLKMLLAAFTALLSSPFRWENFPVLLC